MYQGNVYNPNSVNAIITRNTKVNYSGTMEFFIFPWISVSSSPTGSSAGFSLNARCSSLSVLPSSAKGFSLASAHRFLVNGILRRVTNSQAANLRRGAAKSLFNGQSAPFLALVGVSLASGTGLITKEDEVDCVCSEIRHATGKIRLSNHDEFEEALAAKPHGLSLSDFHLGPVLAKGCNAVVCAAKWTGDRWKDVSHAFEHLKGIPESPKESRSGGSNVNEKSNTDETSFPLAIKMLFNYEAESNAMAILNIMQRETVPSRIMPTVNEGDEQSPAFQRHQKSLPPHPNIVTMQAAFADQVPEIEGSMALFPDALPMRLNPGGYGRNMSLFLVMKRYDMSLLGYLAEYGSSMTWRTSLTILTQVLEGITHLVHHELAHRDLKTDNILLDLAGGAEFPCVVLTDFGCCLSDSKTGLRLPYPSADINRGGNLALMAPEVATAQPGTFAVIDYSKADVWAAGAIAYEIFGERNPFYTGWKQQKQQQLSSYSYRSEDLPALQSDEVPPVVTALIHDMLRRRPNNRLSAEMAATICQLLLWSPKSWFNDRSRFPSTQEILEWLLTLTTKVVCEARFSNAGRALHEYQLVAIFLSRLSMKRVKEAIEWIRLNS